MSTLLTLAIIFFWLLPLFLWSYLIYTSRKFFIYLRENHRELWADAGYPSFQISGTQATSALPKFLWQRQYKNVPDPELRRLGDRAFWGLMGFPASFLSILFDLFLAGIHRSL